MTERKQHHSLKDRDRKDKIENLRSWLKEHSGVFDDAKWSQIKGWGADSFLIHENPRHFQIIAEFKSGAGGHPDHEYAAMALRTWHLLAQELLMYLEAEPSESQERIRIVAQLREEAKHKESIRAVNTAETLRRLADNFEAGYGRHRSKEEKENEHG